ncbi:MAG TPA: LPS export ABC transporter permease LptG [Thermoanaerobaculia bacterium]|nr:LPS export ABC transporter permease LptG [Thermoanaerobaculia bacterium]
MRTLTRYILKEMVGPTLLGFIFYTALILMQRLFDMAGMIIQRSLSLSDVLKLLWLSLPHIVVLTVPMSLLFGVLIAVGRLSSDSEIIAMRALGISTRSIYLPVFLFSLAMFLVNLYLINAVMPKGNRQLQSLQAELLTSTVEKEIRPRLFFDEYENLMIYINDVDRETGHWRGVFVADSRSSDPAEGTSPAAIVRRAQQQAREDEKAEVAALAHRSGQRIIVAERGTLAVVKPTKEVWMNLTDAATHLWDPSRPERYDLNTNATQRILVADPASTNLFSSRNIARSLREMSLDELLDQARLTARGDEITHNLARVEIHKKFAIPFACIAFGILGLPLGITNRRGGKSSGFSLSIGIILFYYVMINNGEHLAASGRIPPAVGMWSANLILLGLGIYLLRRANRETGTQPAEGGILARIRHLAGRVVAAREPESGRVTDEERSLLGRLDITFPNTLDRYVLREFLKVLGLVLVSVMALFIIVDYTDVARKLRDNEVGVGVLLEYYRFLIFQILNWTLPISVLVATLVTFGILSKNNEVTAAKSGGVSLYRLSLPIVLVAAVISVLAYFILDFVLPYSNQRAANLRRTIEGKTPVASASQQKLWYLGQGRYLINFLSYNRDRQELAQVQVFEFHPADFRITRRIYADRARWAGEGWAFENGWIRSFPDGAEASTYTPITRPVTIATYRETPEDFEMELKTPEQMTYAQLRNYIETIRKTGYAADDLAVQLYSKTSWPVISLVMALIALPFAFRIGHRGALYGIGIALALGFCYWMIYAIFTKFGEIGNLPALLSAWSANVLFAIAAVYLFLHVET